MSLVMQAAEVPLLCVTLNLWGTIPTLQIKMRAVSHPSKAWMLMQLPRVLQRRAARVRRLPLPPQTLSLLPAAVLVVGMNHTTEDPAIQISHPTPLLNSQLGFMRAVIRN